MPLHPLADLRALAELAAPSGCAGCRLRGQRWCAACSSALHGQPPRAWRPTPCPPGMPATWAGPAYDGPVREAVVAWKELGRVDLGPELALVLRSSVAAAATTLGHDQPRGQPVAVVPAPSARASTRARGRSPVLELAVAAVGRGPVVDALRLRRPVRDQAGLSAVQRADNLAGAVAVRAREARLLQGLPCVVVDDVVTTGSTLCECARALREGGAGPVVAATVAATRRRSG